MSVAYRPYSEPGDPVDPRVIGVDAPTGGQQIVGITKANPGVLTISTALTVGQLVYVTGVGGMSQLNNRQLTVATGAASGSNYNITLKDGATPVDTTGYGTYTGGGTVTPTYGGAIAASGIATCYNNLFDNGASNTIAWTAVTGAQRYYVYRLTNGLFGYVGQTQNTSFTDPGGAQNIAADISRTPPLQSNPFIGAGHYPAAVGYVDQRRCFAGPSLDPGYFWATRSGTESSMSYSIPTRDDDAIRFRIAARQRCTIKHIVPLADLVLLTENTEFRVLPANGEVLTPNVAIKPQSYVGSGDAAPVVANNNLIFAASRGGHVRELAFNFQAQGFVNGDLCLRAPHLFDNRHIVDMAESKAPFPVIWCVSSDGRLLGLTYVPDQQVGCWHQHDTQDGLFESICVVPEGDVDVLYAVVNRGGQRFIERMEPRQSEDGQMGFYVDCGLSGIGSPSTVFTGLDHLEGKTVAILADGGTHPQRTVVGGQVTLDAPASLVHVGLPITADLKTLPMAMEIQGYGQGQPKNVNVAWIRVFHSRGVFAGPSYTALTEYQPRSTEPYDAPPGLIEGEVKLTLSPSWGLDGEICVRHQDPLPITIVSMAFEFAVGG